MLLTITTTTPPATDLGYLLHKHPGRFQGYDLSFGKAHVFYPEAAEGRCTACLLLDVDPVGTVRGKGQADRVIQLEKKGTASLKSWLDIRPRSPFDHVFLNYQGMPLTDRSIRRLVAKYVERAGIEKRATPHSLRHTFASHKAQAGVSLRQVQEWLGHKSLATTQIYLHLDRQDAHKAMEATSL